MAEGIARLRTELARLRGPGWRETVRLIAVSKFVGAARLREAHALGITDFGENRVQELREKTQQLADLSLTWHFIGQLQRNKVKDVVGKVALVHSLDRLELARDMAQVARKRDVVQEVLVQVNTSGEDSKAGFDPDAVESSLDALLGDEDFAGLRVRGFMTIGPNTDEEGAVRASFRRLRAIHEAATRRPASERFAPGILSMGMSGDFRIALEEGSTMIRLGTAIFGAREVT